MTSPPAHKMGSESRPPKPIWLLSLKKKGKRNQFGTGSSFTTCDSPVATRTIYDATDRIRHEVEQGLSDSGRPPQPIYTS